MIRVPIGNNLLDVNGLLSFQDDNKWKDNSLISSDFDPIERHYNELKIPVSSTKNIGTYKYQIVISSNGWYKYMVNCKLDNIPGGCLESGITLLLGGGSGYTFLSSSYNEYHGYIYADDASTYKTLSLVIGLLGYSNSCINKTISFRNQPGYIPIQIYSTIELYDVNHFDFTFLSSTLINLNWTPHSSGDNVIIATNNTGVFGVPNGNYNIGDIIIGGGTIIYKNNGTSTNLNYNSGDKQYYKIWEYAIGSDSLYYYSESGKTLDVISPPLNFNGQATSDTTILLNWGLNNNNDSVVVAYSTSSFSGEITDGLTYNVYDNTPGGGTVLYVGNSINVIHYGLNSNLHYYYRIWSLESSTTKYSKSIVELNITTQNSVNNPSGFTYTILTPDSLKLLWSLNTNNDPIILASGLTNNFGVPNGGYSIGDNIGDGTIIYTGSSESYIDSVDLIPPYSIWYKIWSLHIHDYSNGDEINVSATTPSNEGGWYGGTFYNGNFYGKWYSGRWVNGKFFEPPAEWHSINPKP